MQKKLESMLPKLKLRLVKFEQEIRDVFSPNYIKFLMIVATIMSCITPVYAGDFFSDLSDNLSTIYIGLLSVSTVVIVIAGTYAWIRWGTARDSKDAKEFEKMLKRIVICWVAIMIFPYLIYKGYMLVGPSARNMSLDDLKDIKPGA